MWASRSTPTVDEFCDLLDQEHSLILEGNFERLQDLFCKKEAWMKDLRHSDQKLIDLTKIREKSARNQGLLQSSAQGLKSASQRISDLMKAQDQHKVYGNDGKCFRVSSASRNIERRA